MKKRVKKSIKPKKSMPHRSQRFGILNHVGDVWTPETFDSQAGALEYLKTRAALYGGLPKHKVVPVRVTVSYIRDRSVGAR